MKKLLDSLLQLAFTAGMFVFNAIFLYFCWLWFIVPIGVPAISIMHAFGVRVAVMSFTRSLYWEYRHNDTLPKVDFWKDALNRAGIGAIAFSIAYITQLFM